MTWGQKWRIQTELSLGQINPRGSAELYFLNAIPIHFGTYEAIFDGFNWNTAFLKIMISFQFVNVKQTQLCPIK